MTPLWKKERLPVAYPAAMGFMEKYVGEMQTAQKPELIWLLEHPSLYTLGTSGHERDVLQPGEIPLYTTGRGGQVTYHGPGQRVGYVMLNLKNRGLDLHQYVHTLENWLIDALTPFGIQGKQDKARIGVWVPLGPQDAKIAAIGIRVRKGIAFHGFALNVHPDLRYFEKIVPCGLRDHRVTSLEALGIRASLEAVDQALQETFPSHFP